MGCFMAGHIVNGVYVPKFAAYSTTRAKHGSIQFIGSHWGCACRWVYIYWWSCFALWVKGRNINIGCGFGYIIHRKYDD